MMIIEVQMVVTQHLAELQCMVVAEAAHQKVALPLQILDMLHLEAVVEVVELTVTKVITVAQQCQMEDTEEMVVQLIPIMVVVEAEELG
jgi:hypothetical protein